MSVSATITVPATTANLGPGFDCLGAALTLYNQFRFTRLEDTITPVTFGVRGLDADRVQQDETNLAYQAYCRFFEHVGQVPPPVNIAIDLGVPLARGLGSSATAIVGGLLGGNLLAGSPLTMPELMQLAIALEGHPDNVVPALIGGCRLATTTTDGQWVICDVPWHFDIAPIVAIPNFELSTAEARRVLPPHYSRADVIFNMGHLGLLLRGLATGRAEWLRAALQDRVHQPYRDSLIPGYEAVAAAAMNVGAYGVVISGAGPTLLAVTCTEQARSVQAAMERAWAEQGIMARVEAHQIDTQGAIAQAHPSTVETE